MMTIPSEVARKIFFDKVHPITAWRNYFNISKEILAEITGLSMTRIDKLEKSNEHLKTNMLVILARAFDVHLQALNFRYSHFSS